MSFKKKFEDDRIYAFEVLAYLAGKLLQERETSDSTSDTGRETQHTVVNKCENHNQEHPIKLEPGDEKTSAYGPHSPRHHQSYILNEFPHANVGLGLTTSSMINSDMPEKLTTSSTIHMHASSRIRTHACIFQPNKANNIKKWNLMKIPYQKIKR